MVIESDLYDQLVDMHRHNTSPCNTACEIISVIGARMTSLLLMVMSAVGLSFSRGSSIITAK